MQVSAASYSRSAPRLTPIVRTTVGAREVWRDFGIDPMAMLDRALLSPPPKAGTPLQNGVKADRATLEDLRAELKQLLNELQSGFDDAKLRSFQSKFASTAASYGVQVEYRRGAPRTNWGTFPQLQVYDQGGPSALHEMTHALQSVIGAVAGLSVQAKDAIGRQATTAEIRQTLPTLSDTRRQLAFEQVVRPMETQAYARFEEGAFHATGMLGKKARDLDFFSERAAHNVDAFVDAYQDASVPRLETGMDARVYGRIGHIARTHTETAVLLGAAGFGYHHLVQHALGVHPVAGACALVPLGCLIYRVVRG